MVKVPKAVIAAAWIVLLTLSAAAEIIVHDIVSLAGQEVTLVAETRGRLMARGGEVVEFFVDGKSLGSGLSGGDGFAYRRCAAPRSGLITIKVKSASEEAQGILLVLKKGRGLVIVDFHGSLTQGTFKPEPRSGSQNAIRKIQQHYPVVIVQASDPGGLSGRSWMKQHRFPEVPLILWRHGDAIDELVDKGVKVRAVIGGAEVIDSLRKYEPVAFSFEEVEGARMVKDWGEIARKLR